MFHFRFQWQFLVKKMTNLIHLSDFSLGALGYERFKYFKVCGPRASKLFQAGAIFSCTYESSSYSYSWKNPFTLSHKIPWDDWLKARAGPPLPWVSWVAATPLCAKPWFLLLFQDGVVLAPVAMARLLQYSQPVCPHNLQPKNSKQLLWTWTILNWICVLLHLKYNHFHLLLKNEISVNNQQST